MRRCPNSPRSHATTLHAGLHIGDDGQPQGRQVPHRIYAAAGQGFKHWMQATSDDRFFTCLPFYTRQHSVHSTMGALASGATLVIVDRFSASRF